MADINNILMQLDTVVRIKDKAEDKIRELISDLVKEHKVITVDLIRQVGKYSMCEATKLYRDANNCTLMEALNSTRQLLGR
jgi:hypothetical protein